jgi:hypothetical protein
MNPNKSDTQADPYWVTIAHLWIRFGPPHLNKHACQASRSSGDRLEEEPGHARPQGAGAEPQPPVRGPPLAQGSASMDGYRSCGRRLTGRMMDGAVPTAARWGGTTQAWRGSGRGCGGCERGRGRGGRSRVRARRRHSCVRARVEAAAKGLAGRDWNASMGRRDRLT